MKAVKFLPPRMLPPPPLTRDELFTFRQWLYWAKEREKRRDRESFKRTDLYFRDATGVSICDYVDDFLEKEKEVAKDAFARTSYSGKVEVGHFEKFLKWRDFCEKI